MTRRLTPIILLGLLGLIGSFRLKAEEHRGAGVRIGVFGLFHPRELVVRSADGGGITVRTERETCALPARESAHLSVLDGTVQGECAGRALGSRALAITSPIGGPAEVELAVPGRIARRFRGRIDITAAGAELVPVVSMDLETAVASVVGAEQAAGTALEALKAQAVATRSYLVASHGRHSGFDFCDTTHCQFLREPPAPGHPASLAARATAGLVLAFRGAPVAALYSAGCGGRTRSLVEAGFPATDGYPYFSVECSYCLRHASAWESRLPLDDDARRLEAARSEGARLAVVRRLGWSAVPGNNFDVVHDRESLVVRGRGLGHGIGLCQAGAAGLAAAGSTFAEILSYYYPGTTLTSAPRQD